MGERDDPLASPTLAQLYIAQGHLGKARRVLNQILAVDAHHGSAHALVQRIESQTAAIVTSELDGARIRVRWKIRGGRERSLEAHAVHVVHTKTVVHGRSVTRSRVSSTPCKGASGEFSIVRPVGAGLVGFALAFLDARGDLAVLATCEPLSWST